MTGRILRSRDTSLANSREQSLSQVSDVSDARNHDDDDSRSSTSSDETVTNPTKITADDDDDLLDTTTVRLLTEGEWPKSETVLEMPKLLTPRSYYEPFEPPAPHEEESKVVEAFLDVSDDAAEEMLLTDFTVYQDSKRYPLEMCCLHTFQTKRGASKFFFDGVLSAGNHKSWVRRVPIHALPIGGYDVGNGSTVAGQIWLQSIHNKRRVRGRGKRGLFYRLGEPAREYRRFWNDFLWVADFAKHFVDYLNVMEDNKVDVTMQSFTSDFCRWLRSMHGEDSFFAAWKTRHPSDDFRTSVVAHLGFLRKECSGVFDDTLLNHHPLWKQAYFQDRYKMKEDSSNQTVVTPYIHDLFEHMPFADVLEPTQLRSGAERLRNILISSRHMEKPHAIDTTVPTISSDTGRIKNVKRGDTISTKRDESGAWKLEKAIGDEDVDRWFALVQDVKFDGRGQKYFDVIWYYRPVDTLCGIMKYPWKNELFLSEHCSCNETHKIMEHEVLGVHDVHFGGTAATSAELFCRQTYDQDSRKWMTLEEHHLRCEHVRGDSNREEDFKRGDTVLVCLEPSRLPNQAARSEPCVVVRTFLENNARMYELRRLLRRAQVEPEGHAKSNELVWTEKLVQVRAERLDAPCYVRFFNIEQQIPSPYDRDGVGGFFYVTHQENNSTSGPPCVPLERCPESLRQGFDPKQEVEKLRGLDLFCGGGNFGRGLEDSGAIEMKWINDYNKNAIHTYMANVEGLETVEPFLGSIDLLQRHALKGDWTKMKNVPKIGDVDFISAGSPCPGFSTLTGDKTTKRQRKNQSLVASFASFVDVYRPKYGLLENVAGIISPKVNRHQDVFSQLICAVVGLGYQLRFFMRDAYACGSPQTRKRVFLIFAAPGCRLPEVPLITHSHPEGVRNRSLGTLPTGDPMGEREFPRATPFRFRTALEATADLPRVYDGKTETCVAFPDHRIAIGTTKAVRLPFENIPIQPFGMNFSQAWYGIKQSDSQSNSSEPWLTAAQRQVFPRDKTNGKPGPTSQCSSAYGRIHPHLPVNAVVTKQTPRDFKNGQLLHWQEHRVLTLLEARRAQGFRDEEVLLGTMADQFRIVGNSVAREVAVAIGLTIREAWLGTLHDNNDGRNSPETAEVINETEQSAEQVDSTVDMTISDEPLTDDTQQAMQATMVQLSPIPSVGAAFPSIVGDDEDTALRAHISKALVTPADTPGRRKSRERLSSVYALDDDDNNYDDDDDTGTFSPTRSPQRSPPPSKGRVGMIKKEADGEASSQRRLSAQSMSQVAGSTLRRQSSILDAFSFGAAVSTQKPVSLTTSRATSESAGSNQIFSLAVVGGKRKRGSTTDVETNTDGTSTPTDGSVDGHRPKKQRRSMAHSLTRYRMSRSNSPMPR